MNDEIKSAIEAASDENPSVFAEKINSVLMTKVSDALKTKKMEISNKWLNDIEPPQEEE
jgi:hypothetical protein